MDASRFRDREYETPPAGDERPGPSGGSGPSVAGALVPPGFGGPPPAGGRGRGGRGRAPPDSAAAAAAAGSGGRFGGGGGGGRGPPRAGRGPLPPDMGARRGGRGPPLPGGLPPGMGGPSLSKQEVRMRREERREEQRAALLKRQVAGMEVSPTMLARSDVEARDAILRGGPDVAPPSSFEELPAAQHCYWADALLAGQAQLQAPSLTAPGVDHTAAIAAAMQLHEQPPGANQAVINAKLGDFVVVVDAELAGLIASS